MRSRTVIIGDERQEDFDRLAAGWRAEYGDEGQATRSLLERVILSDWYLQRAERRYMEAEGELGETGPLEWSEEQHKKIELYLRYKARAEGSFYRALYALRGLRKDRLKEELDLEKMRREMRELGREAVREAAKELQQEKASAEPAARAQKIFRGQNQSSKKRRKIAVLDQWVEVEIRDSKAVTKLYPSNEELIKEGQAMEQAPELVYRRLNFPQGIPEEYAWVSGPNAERFERGGMGTQRMTVETWLDVIEREAASGTGHVGPTGAGNLPRPEERGGCECEVCVRNREVLERRAGLG